MKTETEIRFYDINLEDFLADLKRLGAKRVYERKKLKRVIYIPHDSPKTSWIRLRQEFSLCTLTYKQKVSASVDGVLELEVVVSDFESTRTILNKLGIPEARYQENFREEWVFEGVKIDCDEWPKLKPLVEFESESIEKIDNLISKLGLNKDRSTTDSIDEIYTKEVGIDILAMDTLTF